MDVIHIRDPLPSPASDTNINNFYAVETEFDFAYEKQNYTNRFSNSILRKFIKYLLLFSLFYFIFEKTVLYGLVFGNMRLVRPRRAETDGLTRTDY